MARAHAHRRSRAPPSPSPATRLRTQAIPISAPRHHPSRREVSQGSLRCACAVCPPPHPTCIYRIRKLRATHSRERDTKHAYSNLRVQAMPYEPHQRRASVAEWIGCSSVGLSSVFIFMEFHVFVPVKHVEVSDVSTRKATGDGTLQKPKEGKSHK